MNTDPIPFDFDGIACRYCPASREVLIDGIAIAIGAASPLLREAALDAAFNPLYNIQEA
jgi:hypothetical protein